jgi:hypothetical protein
MEPRRNRGDSPLTEEIISAILVYLALDKLDVAFTEAISRVAASVIEDEIRNTTELLSLEHTIDSVAIAREWSLMMSPRIPAITDFTLQLVKNLLDDALSRNLTIVQAAQELNALFDRMGKGRAILIARTEVLGSMNFASFRVFQIGNVPFKRWLATMDDRVRDTHAEANNQLRGVSEAFDIGGSAMMYPGDPRGPAGEVINCRCYIIPEMNARSSIWTQEASRAIWRMYIRRAVQWDSKMLLSVQHEFDQQRLGVLTILDRYAA